MSDDLVLFDLPATEPPARTSPVDRGRAGSTYTRTVVADVSIEDGPAVCAAVDPDTLAGIDEGLAAAWHAAVEPYAPLRDIPGITWTPVGVTVDHVPAKARYAPRLRPGP